MLTITPEEVKQRLDAGEALQLVDVRESFEHDAFNIGGLLVPLGKIKDYDTSDIDDLKESEVILYCRSGNRSGQAALILESMGFSNVKNLVGGMIAWQEKF
jgi:rhodanese-related sulfurtransferase